MLYSNNIIHNYISVNNQTNYKNILFNDCTWFVVCGLWFVVRDS